MKTDAKTDARTDAKAHAKTDANGHHHGGYGIDARAGIRALEPMSELPEYRIADGGPDIRGWHLATSEGRAGCVRDLLVDTAAMSVRFLDVELDPSCAAPEPAAAPGQTAQTAQTAPAAPAGPRPGAAHAAPARHVLVPIALVDLDDEFHEVRLPRVYDNAALRCLPDYRGEPLTPDRERAMAACFGLPAEAAIAPSTART